MKTKIGSHENVKSFLSSGFEPGSPTLKTGMITTTPQQLILYILTKNRQFEYIAFNINSVFSLVAIIAIILRSLKFLCLQYDKACSGVRGKIAFYSRYWRNGFQ